eukprot:171569-Rhodomonas_salina.1
MSDHHAVVRRATCFSLHASSSLSCAALPHTRVTSGGESGTGGGQAESRKKREEAEAKRRQQEDEAAAKRKVLDPRP